MQFLERPIEFSELVSCIDSIRFGGLWVFLKTFQRDFNVWSSFLGFTYPILLFIVFYYLNICRIEGKLEKNEVLLESQEQQKTLEIDLEEFQKAEINKKLNESNSE